MRTRYKNLLLIALLGLPVFFLNYSSAVPSFGVPPASGQITFSGWPFVAMIGEARSTNSSVVVFEHRKFAVTELLIDGVVSLLLIGLAFVALTVFICPRFPQFSLFDMFAFTSAVAFVTIYFLADPDIFGPYFRLHFAPNGPNINLSVSDRPLWQNATSATYMLVAVYALISILGELRIRSQAETVNRNNKTMHTKPSSISVWL